MSARNGSAETALDELADQLRDRLAAGDGDPQLTAAERIAGLVDAEAGLLDAETRTALARRVTERTLGLGPLQPLLDDPAVDEVLVGAGGQVWVERRGRIEPAGVAFEGEAELRDVIERVLAPTGRRVDEAAPMVDARLPDGSRVNVVVPPLAVDGPALTIRRFRRQGFSGADLVAAGTLPAELLGVLARAVRGRCNILVCGGTGSGKTTTLNALSGFVDPAERIVTIEDAAELRLAQPHVVRLEARPPSLEGAGEVTIRALVRNALRMRPDRVVVGEVRGPEAPHPKVRLLPAALAIVSRAPPGCGRRSGPGADVLSRRETSQSDSRRAKPCKGVRVEGRRLET